MLKFTSLILCLVAASLSKVSAIITEEEKNAFRAAMAPIIAECSVEHGVSEGDIEAAKKDIQTADSADAIKPCFLGCVFKKLEFIDSKGLLNAEKGLSNLKKFVSDDEEYAKFADIGKQCSEVNDEPVSDGEAGCERAKLALTCAIKHKTEIPL